MAAPAPSSIPKVPCRQYSRSEATKSTLSDLSSPGNTNQPWEVVGTFGPTPQYQVSPSDTCLSTLNALQMEGFMVVSAVTSVVCLLNSVRSESYK
jgi:hypothetical protein